MNKIQAGQLVHALAQACARADHCFDNVPDIIINIIKNNLWKNFIVEESQKEISYTRFEDFVTARVPEGLGTTMKTLENICRDNPEAISLLTKVTKRPRGRPRKNPEPESVVEETPQEIFVPPEEVIQEEIIQEQEETQQEISTAEEEKEPEEAEGALEEVEPKIAASRQKILSNIQDEPPKIAASRQKILSNIQDKNLAPTGTTRATGHRRLEDQRPDLHKKVLDGEMTVHAACLEAGFRKKTFSISGNPKSAAKTIAKNYDKDDIKQLIDELQALL